MIFLTDDGTLDTVLECSDCGEQMRYNYPTAMDEDEGDYIYYERWTDQIITDETQEHECHQM